MILCNYFYPKDKKLVIEKKNPLKTKENKVSSLMHTCMEQTISCQALVSYRYHGLSVWLAKFHAGAFKAFLLMQPVSATVEEINSRRGIKKKLNSGGRRC